MICISWVVLHTAGLDAGHQRPEVDGEHHVMLQHQVMISIE
jgi:hypothetical protein